VKFVIQKDQLTIRFEGFEKLWALQRRIQVPRYAIAEVDFRPDVPVMQDFRGYLRRMPGFMWPWTFLAGTYYRENEKEFWYVRIKQPGLLTIELKADTLNHDRIKLSCDPETARRIADWWRQGRGTA
jgi:hypothetical protein